jgi:E3 Ubiquitin ligase
MDVTPTSEISSVAHTIRQMITNGVPAEDASVFVEVQGTVFRSDVDSYGDYNPTVISLRRIFRDVFEPSRQAGGTMIPGKVHRDSIVVEHSALPFSIISNAPNIADSIREINVHPDVVASGCAELELFHSDTKLVSDTAEEARLQLLFPEAPLFNTSFHERTEVLRIGDLVYALGHARLRSNGTLELFHKANSQEPMLISVRSEAELTHELQQRSRTQATIGAIISALGIFIIATDVITKT